MPIDPNDEAAAAKRRSETRAARKIVQVCLAVLIAGTLAAAMRAHGAAGVIGQLAATELLALGALGFLAVRTPHPTLRLVAVVFVVVLTALSIGAAMLVAAAAHG